MDITVGISDMRVSQRRDDVLATSCLGSCVGLTLYEPVARVGGLIHCMLPLSQIDPPRAAARPCMFTDTGVARLLDTLMELGAERGRLVAKAAGAASLLDSRGLFKIGERNYTVLRAVLSRNGVSLSAEDIGGTQTRSMTLLMSEGKTVVKAGGKEIEL